MGPTRRIGVGQKIGRYCLHGWWRQSKIDQQEVSTTNLANVLTMHRGVGWR